MQILHTPLYIQDLSISWFGDPGGDTKDNGVVSFPVTPALARCLLSPSHISLPLSNTVLVPLFPLSHPSNLVIILWGNPGNVGRLQTGVWTPDSQLLSQLTASITQQTCSWTNLQMILALPLSHTADPKGSKDQLCYMKPSKLQRKINIFKFYSSLSSSKRSPKQTFGADFTAS